MEFMDIKKVQKVSEHDPEISQSLPSVLVFSFLVKYYYMKANACSLYYRNEALSHSEHCSKKVGLGCKNKMAKIR